VKNIGFPTKRHPKPYQLQYINCDIGIIVKEQVNIPIFISKYYDWVLHDIVPL